MKQGGVHALSLTDAQRAQISADALDHGQLLDMAFSAGIEAALDATSVRARGHSRRQCVTALARLNATDDLISNWLSTSNPILHSAAGQLRKAIGSTGDRPRP